jgi:transcriptional regulator with XRE-family HTH domain
MPKVKDQLKALIQELRDGGMSLRGMAKLTGGAVSHQTFNNILNDKQKQVDMDTLQSIVRALEIPGENVKDYFFPEGVETPADQLDFVKSRFFDLYSVYRKLPDHQKGRADVIVDMVGHEFRRRLKDKSNVKELVDVFREQVKTQEAHDEKKHKRTRTLRKSG